MRDFRLADLYAALDAQRQSRGLTWQQAVLEINTGFGHASIHPIARSSVTSLRTKAVAEGDAVLAMLKWLNRTPESFLPGDGGAHSSPGAHLPDPPPPLGLRFDTRKLHAAVNAQRTARGLTWQQVARELGLSPNTLTNMSTGARTGFPHVMRITRWLDRSLAEFTRFSRW
jgi:hypothetical protein